MQEISNQRMAEVEAGDPIGPCDRAMPSVRLIGRRHNDGEQQGVVRNSLPSPTILAEDETVMNLSNARRFSPPNFRNFRKTRRMSQPEPPPVPGRRQGHKFEDTTTLTPVLSSVFDGGRRPRVG